MKLTRLELLARAGSISSIEDPAAPSGGSQKPQEGATNDGEQAPDAGNEEPKEGEGESTNDFDSLPAWAQDQIKSLRNGEARYRTANKDLTATNEQLQSALKDAKSQDDIDAAIKTHQGRIEELELENARAVHTSGMSKAQLALVHGKTPDEIEASAKAVRDAFAEAGHDDTPPGDVDGGLNPGGAGGPLDPRALAREALRRR